MNETNTILVVEDEPIVRMLVVDYLEELGYRIIEAKDADAALGVIDSGQTLSLLLTDVGLPGMNGRQLAEAARRLRPALKILFATGYADSGDGGHDSLGGGVDIVSKPFDLDVLGAKVSQLIGGQ